MDRNVYMCAILLGIIGSVLSLFSTGQVNLKSSISTLSNKFSFWMGMALPLTVFAFTLPTKPPFADGHGFGKGFLIGGIFSFLSFLTLASNETFDRSFSCILKKLMPLVGSLAALAIIALSDRHVLIDGFLGVAIGYIATSFFFAHSVSNSRNENEIVPLLVVGSGFATTLAMTICLGEYHGDSTENSKMLGSISMLVGMLTPLCAIASTIPTELIWRPFSRMIGISKISGMASGLNVPDEDAEKWKNALQVILSLSFLIAASKLIEKRFEVEHLSKTVIAGVIGSVICWWLQSESNRRSDDSEMDLAHYKLFATLTVFAITFLAYSWMHALGIAFAMLPVWCVVSSVLIRSTISARPSIETNVLTPAIFGTIVLAIRFVEVRFHTELRNVGVLDQAGIAGFFVGISLPWALASFVSQKHSVKFTPVAETLKLSFSGVLLLATPAIFAIVWNSRYLIALMGGLALSAAGFTVYSQESRNSFQRYFRCLFALAGAIAISQWAHHILIWEFPTRAEKIKILGYFATTAIIVIVLADIYERRTSRSSQQLADQQSAGGVE